MFPNAPMAFLHMFSLFSLQILFYSALLHAFINTIKVYKPLRFSSIFTHYLELYETINFVSFSINQIINLLYMP